VVDESLTDEEAAALEYLRGGSKEEAPAPAGEEPAEAEV
jgi:hypothetical protein